MSDLCRLEEIGPDDRAEVGGKAFHLGRMIQTGLPVPAGFCLTTAAYRAAVAQPQPGVSADLLRRIEECCRELGGETIAVRSSATVEDGAASSYAGQFQSLIGITHCDMVLPAILACWESLHSRGVAAYRDRQRTPGEDPAMAVILQRFIPSDSSGVIFTRDPLDSAAQQMVVEAAWGLGESVVAGHETPDRYDIDRESGRLLKQTIAAKTTMRTVEGKREVPQEKQRQPCLDASQLVELARLARRVEELFGHPQDIEWAWANGQFWLLQSRPITAGALETIRREEIAALARKAEPAGTVWSRYNLAESLPCPTPMTWSIIQNLLSPRGGFGRMYRDLGFRPDPSLGQSGIYDLVCGRPYCNLSREPRMYANGLPLGHSFSTLKKDPRKALDPHATLDFSRAGWRFWVFLPFYFVRTLMSLARLRAAGRSVPDLLRTQIFPAFAEEAAHASADDLSAMDSAAVQRRLQDWIKKTLCDFASHALKPTVLAGAAIANLEVALLRCLGPERTRAALGMAMLGVRPDHDADLPQAIAALQNGQLSRDDFLRRFGHRGSQEMELAEPRWNEDSSAVDRLLIKGQRPTLPTSDEYRQAWMRLTAEANLSDKQRSALERELEALRTFLSLRETAKHYSMMGYAEIRRCLTELDRRYRLNGDIFFLTLEELPRLIAGEDFTSQIQQRKRRRTLALSLEVPRVLFSDDLEVIGRRSNAPAAGALRGVALSPGIAEGPALVLDNPTSEPEFTEPYILVCPTTDPAWIPLFSEACGLVMEAGGVLSHGAIVAREFGIPAVAGFPGILQQVKTGQRLRIDGGRGTVEAP
jgi:rifampicin phosphotransferase